MVFSFRGALIVDIGGVSLPYFWSSGIVAASCYWDGVSSQMIMLLYLIFML